MLDELLQWRVYLKKAEGYVKKDESLCMKRFFVSYFPMEQAEEIAVFLNSYAFDPRTPSRDHLNRK
jgi:hypothetical protein